MKMNLLKNLINKGFTKSLTLGIIAISFASIGYGQCETTPDEANLEDLEFECSVDLADLDIPTATSDCDGEILGILADYYVIDKDTTITWLFIDSEEDTVTQVQNILIIDTIAPTPDQATMPDIVEDCSFDLRNLIFPTATDDCSHSDSIIVTVNVDTSLTITQNRTITWTFKDLAGNTSTVTQNIIVDNEDPVADEATLDDILVGCGIIMDTITRPTATDNCSGEIIGVADLTGEITSSQTITWTYTDGNGNTTTQTQNIVVTDSEGPVPNIENLPAITDCIVKNIIAPTATDACEGGVVGTTTASFPITSDQTITWTYTDSKGNTTTQTQEIIIGMDNTVTVLDEYTVYANAYGNPLNTGDYSYQWYSCANDEPELTANGRVFVATTSGEYYVEITNADGSCSATSDCIQMIVPLSVQEEMKNKVVAFPNPTQGQFTITTNDQLDNATLEVFSTLGNVIYSTTFSGNETQINLEKYPNGIYFVKVNNSSAIKVVKN